jgi:amino acid adenylation domain-containing protein
MDGPDKLTFELSTKRRSLLEALLRDQGPLAPDSGGRTIPRRTDSGPAPLSFAQERLWFLDRFQPGSPFYNVPVALHLSGVLDVPALAASLGEIVRRHEALRTTFTVRDGQPVQCVGPARPVALPLTDLRHLPEGERQAEAQRLAAAEAQRPFDLEHGPLLRVGLIRLAAQEHVLLSTMHHIATDGWSQGVFVRELRALYPALAANRPSPLPPLPLQYADYAVWQRQWLQGDILEWQMGYWMEQLRAVPALALPTDRPRPALQRFRGAAEHFAVPREVSDAVQALCRREGLTPFMVMLAAFAVLLARSSGQDDVSVGTPVANRPSAELEGLIGFFVNTLVLRGNLAGNPTLRELLRRVREAALGAYGHADVPFEKLVAELQPQRDPSRNPLFQVMFSLQNPLKETLSLPGLQITHFLTPVTTTQFDLSLALRETPHGLIGSLEYNTDFFDETTARRMVRQYQGLLAATPASLDTRIANLPLLTEAERRQVLFEWNRPGAELPRSDCLNDLVEAQAARVPDAVAVVDGAERLTYRELNRRANQLAHRLRRAGVGPDVCVGLCLDRSPELVTGILAILKAGGAYVPLDPAYPPDRLKFLLLDSQAPIVVTRERLADNLDVPGLHILCVDREGAGIETESGQNVRGGATPDNLAYVIYTSGSTGRPKGCLVSHHNVVRLLQATAACFRFDEADVWTLFHSYAFDFSVWEIFGALARGGRLVVVPYLVSRSPRAFYDLLCREQVTVLNQTPSAFYQLMRAEETAGAGPGLALRLVIFGGEALEVERLRLWFTRHGQDRPRLVNMYGITETTVHVTYYPLSAGDATASLGSPIGRPIGDLQAYVLDASLQPVPVGVPGELFIGGAGLARGYLGRPAATAERFLPDPYGARHGGRLYRSGDRARWRTDGSLEFLGRTDGQVKIHGHRIEPGEIEAALAAHPTVRQAVVVAWEDPAGEKRLVAYLVPAANPAPSVSELRGFLQQKLPEYMRPAVYQFLEKLPLTANGKLDRAALPSPDLSRPVLESPLVAPRTELEHLLVDIWRGVLFVEDIGAEDSFFELGGNSIQAALVINQLQQRLGESISLVGLFEAPTLAGFAAYLRERHPATVARLGASDATSASPGASPAPQSPEAAEGLLANLDQLSEDQLDALLKKLQADED